MSIRNKTILIVEDEGVVALDLRSRLEQMGYYVPEIFDNGKDLLEYGMDYFPDLVIMDVMIKGELDGIQTAQRFKEIHDTPIIFLTAYSDDITFQRAKLSDAYAFLIKPFNQRELETTIEIAFFRHNIFKKISSERKQFFNILNDLKDSVIATNSDGYVIFYNDSAKKFFQLDKQHSNTYQPIQDLLPFIKTIPQNPNLINDLLYGKLNQFKLDNVKITWHDKKLAFDLSIFPFNNDVFEVEGLVLVAHDIGEKLKFLEELQKSERQYRSLFERNLAGVVQKKLDGTIINCNDAFAKIFGYESAHDMIGLNFISFYQSPLERTALLELIKSTGFLKNVELCLKKADGTNIWVLENIHITNNFNEKLLEATVIDITSKKIVENELKKSQNNLLNLIEHTNIIIWSLNSQFELISFNTQYAEKIFKIFGFYPKQGLDTKTFGEKHIKFWEKYYRMAFEGEKFSKEMQMTIKGNTYHYEVHFHPIKNLYGITDAITIYANDITEKKNQELEKQKTLDLLDAVFNQSGDGLAIADYKGNILNCNQKLIHLLGFSSFDELVSEHKKEILIPKFKRNAILKILKKKLDWQGEVLYEKQGFQVWLDVSFKHIKAGNEFLILVRISDITEKIKTEEMRLLLETAISNTSDGILIIENSTPPVAVYANEAYFKITKRNKAEFINHPLSVLDKITSLIPKDYLEKMKQKQTVKFEFENQREDLTSYICELEFTPIEFLNGKVYFLIIIRDITERKRNEQELMNAKMNQQNLIIKTIVDTQEFERRRFAEDLHDSLGQMLSALKINIAALGTHLLDNSELYHKSIDLLDSAIQELRTISHNLMPSSLEQLGLSSALKELCKIMSTTNHIQIHYQTFGNKISLDKSFEITLYRVVQELLNNSFKHSNCKTIYLQLFYYSDSILLMYEDDGNGFDLQEVQKKSKGIGLKNIEHRIKLINGSIHFESKKNKGFLCSIEIPIANI